MAEDDKLKMKRRRDARGRFLPEAKNHPPSAITRMAERVDAWKSACSLLKELKYGADLGPSPYQVGELACWLYEGSAPVPGFGSDDSAPVPVSDGDDDE